VDGSSAPSDSTSAEATSAEAASIDAASTDVASTEAFAEEEEEEHNGVEMSEASVQSWVDELAALRTKHGTARAIAAMPAEAARETAKHEHYARLLKLPRLVDEALATWIDPADDLSDKQIFHELLRMMGLVESVEPRLMRAMVEAVKQHRLRRERAEVDKGDWAEHGAESLSLRAGMRHEHPASIKRASAMVNRGGDGSDFAIFVASLLHAIGAHVRLSLGCSKNVTIPPPTPDGPPWVVAAHAAAVAAEPWRGEVTSVCQLHAEVRLGRTPSKMATWVRTWLPGSRWLGKVYHYRLDRDGYAWLTLDWIDGNRGQRPGAPYKPYESATIYYPHELRWEVEGEEFDSNSQPKLRYATVEALKMGGR